MNVFGVKMNSTLDVKYFFGLFILHFFGDCLRFTLLMHDILLMALRFRLNGKGYFFILLQTDDIDVFFLNGKDFIVRFFFLPEYEDRLRIE